MPLLVSLIAVCATGCALAQTPPVPERSLWLRGGIVQTNPEKLPIPAGLREADHVTRVWPLGMDLFAWTEEYHDTDGTLLRFRLRMGETERPTGYDLLSGTDPFGVGQGWHILDLGWAEKTEADALDVRVRLPGSGLQSQVFRITLAEPHTVAPAPEGTRVWSSFSGDRSVKAVDTWALTTDDEMLPDNQRRYGSIWIAGLSNPQGRLLWEIKRHDAIPPWAAWAITSVAVTPDGKSVVYANPTGIWQVAVSGGEPQRLWPMPEGEVAEQLQWARDGSGLYFVRRPVSPTGSGTPGEPAIVFLQPGTARAVTVLEQAESLCLIPAQ